MNYPINKIRLDFPILSKKINYYPLIYLDNAASSQKPDKVIISEYNFYSNNYASVHRGIHFLSNKATIYMENIRAYIAKFINAEFVNEIIFIKGSTEGVNLVSYSWGCNYLKSGDNILITEMEHHANIIPWYMLKKKKNITLRYIPLLLNGMLDVSKLKYIIDKRTRIFSITQLSNVLGILNSLLVLIYIVQNLSNAVIFIDGSQGMVHQYIDVQYLNCDFYVFSGHKFYGPSGTGVLYLKKILSDIMPPWEGGGSMVNKVNLIDSIVIFNESPWCFEAGTPNIAGIVGLKAAFNYVNSIRLINIEIYEYELMRYTLLMLFSVPNLVLYGFYDRVGVVSFNLTNIHSYDVCCFLDNYGIAIRTGHHCAMPLLIFFNISSMCRLSLAIFTNYKDINIFVNILLRINFLFLK